MTRWPHTWQLLTGETPLTAAQQAVQDARAKVVEAENRGDDRDLGRALMHLRQATTDLLRAETGR